MTTLYLTAQEKSLFDGLPDSIKQGWTVEAEKSDAYETPEVLRMRMQMVDLGKYPSALGILERLKNGEDLRNINLEGLSPDVLRELAFTIGAKGMAVLISRLLKSARTDKDIEGLAGMSLIRHEILEVNSSISYSNKK